MQIFDNDLVAHEYIHFLNNKRFDKDGFIAIKLGVSKAYDRLEWMLLTNVMQKLGFCSQWVNWVMECIPSVSYSININGKKRGIH